MDDQDEEVVNLANYEALKRYRQRHPEVARAQMARGKARRVAIQEARRESIAVEASQLAQGELT